jgi:hypothetical protein
LRKRSETKTAHNGAVHDQIPRRYEPAIRKIARVGEKLKKSEWSSGRYRENPTITKRPKRKRGDFGLIELSAEILECELLIILI